MANYGAQTDHFGILAIVDGTGTLADILEITASPKTPIAQNRADAQNENGDIVASTWFGNAGGTLYDASSTFAVTSGTLDTSLLQLGELATGKVVKSIDIKTSNNGWPELTVTGILGCAAIVAPTGDENTFTLPELDVDGAMRAQPLGFTTDAACRCTGSSLSASIDISEVTDGEGEVAAHGVSGGIMTVTGEFVSVTGAPAWTVTLTDAEETQAPGAEESSAAYDVGTGTYEYILTRDT